MAGNSAQNAARRNKDDEFYTRLEDISEELNNYKKHFKDKVVLCNCDDPEWSNFWIFLHQNFSEFGIKKLISTHYNADGSSSYVMEYTGGNDVDPKDWHQRSLKGNGDFASDECVELLKEADLCITNPPFSIAREKFIPLLFEYDKKFIIIGDLNWISYKTVFPLFKNNKMWLGYNYVKSFVRPNGEIQKFGNKLWFTNLDIPKRHASLIPTLKYEFANHPELYQKYDNYDAINVDKVKNIPYDYYGKMGVPITFMDKYNQDEFEIIGHEHDLNGNGGNGISEGQFETNGKGRYKRLLIRRKMKKGEREAQSILENIGMSFNLCYYDNAEDENNPDFQYQDGRYLEVTHTNHNLGNIDCLNRFNQLPINKRNDKISKAWKAYIRKMNSDYLRDENGEITEEGKKQIKKDEKLIKEHFGLDAISSETADICCRHFDCENIFEAIEKKEEKHANKDLDVFVFAHDYEIKHFINRLNNNKKTMFSRLNKTHFKKIFVCSFKFDENKYDTGNYILINVDNINNTFEIYHEGVTNKD